MTVTLFTLDVYLVVVLIHAPHTKGALLYIVMIAQLLWKWYYTASTVGS